MRGQPRAQEDPLTGRNPALTGQPPLPTVGWSPAGPPVRLAFSSHKPRSRTSTCKRLWSQGPDCTSLQEAQTEASPRGVPRPSVLALICPVRPGAWGFVWVSPAGQSQPWGSRVRRGLVYSTADSGKRGPEDKSGRCPSLSVKPQVPSTCPARGVLPAGHR